MSYFTKYLPVEGEIKIGDKVSLDTGISTCETEEQEVYYKDQDYKKLMLFLCSLDINIGDGVKIDVLENGIFNDFIFQEILPQTEEEPETWVFTGTGNYYYYPEDEVGYKPFKVIGEISKDAKWVKEGDEFTEDSIKLKIKNGNYITEAVNIKHVPKKEVKKWLNLILIKCPCCGVYR